MDIGLEHHRMRIRHTIPSLPTSRHLIRTVSGTIACATLAMVLAGLQLLVGGALCATKTTGPASTPGGPVVSPATIPSTQPDMGFPWGYLPPHDPNSKWV